MGLDPSVRTEHAELEGCNLPYLAWESTNLKDKTNVDNVRPYDENSSSVYGPESMMDMRARAAKGILETWLCGSPKSIDGSRESRRGLHPAAPSDSILRYPYLTLPQKGNEGTAQTSGLARC